MNVACARIGAVCLAAFWPLGIFCPAAWAADAALAALRIESPVAWQVVQRRTAASGSVVVCGTTTAGQGGDVAVRFLKSEAEVVEEVVGWRAVPVQADGSFRIAVDVPAGGWYRCEARATRGAPVLAETAVEHVGVGEVFVVAGQSNSANFGEERLRPATGLVSTFDSDRWRPADDPQPGAEGGGGSFLPPLGDALAERFGVPVGFVACGIGGTSVREWLPAGVAFPAPPTVENRIRQRPDGWWECDGAAYAMLVRRMKTTGPEGFRAVLWHQGESDANQGPTRTLPGNLYREHLATVIRSTRRDIERDVPWFVAQTSYHVPGDESSPDIRAAQAAIAADGLALAGPDTDTLTGSLREAGGQGVHFSGAGLRAHAALWLEKIAPWLEEQCAQ